MPELGFFVYMDIITAQLTENDIELSNFNKFDKYKTISRNGGLKFDFKKPVWINKDKFNTYQIVHVIDNPVLIFEGEFDQTKAKRAFLDYLHAKAVERLKDINNHFDHLNSILNMV